MTSALQQTINSPTASIYNFLFDSDARGCERKAEIQYMGDCVLNSEQFYFTPWIHGVELRFVVSLVPRLPLAVEILSGETRADLHPPTNCSLDFAESRHQYL
jgi:hypothetical protein